jgi:arylsulfatase A-like enzyme
VLAVLVAATLLTVACQRGRPTEPRSLLLITLDTTRADRLGAWGYEEARTPTIDRLATEGTLYERAYAPAPETLPVHASLFTGLYPPSHGVRLNLSYRLPEPAQTLAELLQQRGLFTAAVISAGVLDQQYGLNQGFVVYDDMSESSRRERRAEAVTDRALEVLAGQEEERFFLWVHYYDPHDPYDPPEPFAGPEDAPPVDPRLYDLEIAYTDHWIGRLLDELEARSALEETLIVLVADHGESLGDHGESAHTLFIYDSTIHVPLILVGPGIEAGQRVSEPVPSIDIFATLTGIFGLTPPENSSRPLPGLGLEPNDSEEPNRMPRVAYSESMTPPLRYGWNVLQAARSDKWLYIRAPREELYPLDGTTPAQQANVAQLHPEVLQNHRRLLGRTLNDMSARTSAPDSISDRSISRCGTSRGRVKCLSVPQIYNSSTGRWRLGWPAPRRGWAMWSAPPTTSRRRWPRAPSQLKSGAGSADCVSPAKSGTALPMPTASCCASSPTTSVRRMCCVSWRSKD